MANVNLLRRKGRAKVFKFEDGEEHIAQAVEDYRDASQRYGEATNRFDAAMQNVQTVHDYMDAAEQYCETKKRFDAAMQEKELRDSLRKLFGAKELSKETRALASAAINHIADKDKAPKRIRELFALVDSGSGIATIKAWLESDKEI